MSSRRSRKSRDKMKEQETEVFTISNLFSVSSLQRTPPRQ